MLGKVTIEQLEELNACEDGLAWFRDNCTELRSLKAQALRVFKHRFDWANWGLAQLMDKRQAAQYAVFAARSVLSVYEAKYPEDLRPRKAIEAAEEFLKTGKAAAALDADAAWAAARAAAADADSDIKTLIINYGIKLLEE